ncbi:MAG: EpsG family protein [Alcanivorax sp.]|nr:EpsG family protein [Alcanivorax sp.]
MIVYWILFLIPFLGLLFSFRLGRSANLILWCLAWVIFVLVIGCRQEVGGDWFTYLDHLESRGGRDLWEVLISGDQGYYLINYIVNHLGGGIVWVNLICAMIVMTGVVRFSLDQPKAWLCLVVAVPYLIIVVSMGYTRQSAALGFLFLGLASLSRGKSINFFFWVLLGATFHKSVVLMLPVAALSASKHRAWNFFWVGVISLLAAYFFVLDSVDKLWANYVTAEYESQGGLVRVLMNSVPALIFLFVGRRIVSTEQDFKLWRWISIFSLACIPLVVVSSTATDRVALYLIPLQLYVFSRLYTVSSDGYSRALIVIGTVFYYALVQLVWLNFAANADAWLPYQMYPFAS